MGDTLDQNEVDALLSAINEGEVKPDSAAKPHGDTVEPVFSSFGENIGVEVRSHDFNRPERVSKDQIRALAQLHEGFARSFGASLSGFLRTIVEVEVKDLEQLAYSEYIQSLPNPTSFNLIGFHPLGGAVCLEISPMIIYPIIDRLLGGSNEQSFLPKRPLTQIELRLVRKIVDRAMESLREAWSSIVPLECTLQEMETNPQLAQIVPPNEVVVSVGFDLRLGEQAGTMNLCIPFNVIEPVIDKLSAQGWYKGTGRNEVMRQRITKILRRAPVQAAAILAETRITVGDLADMNVGDVIVTDKAAMASVLLAVKGKRKFFAKLGQHKGRRALKIDRKITPDDRV